MTRPARVLLSLLALGLALGRPAEAASFTLTPAEQAEAIRLGARSITSDEFGDEWRVVNATGESVTVITPFHRLALAARHAAFRNEPLRAQDRDRMLDELKDRLMLWVSLYGPRPDFARYLTPRLLVDDREVRPIMVQNERTALRQEDGRFLARCVYWFPAGEVGGTGRPVLVVSDPDGQPVSRFTIDLASMR